VLGDARVRFLIAVIALVHLRGRAGALRALWCDFGLFALRLRSSRSMNVALWPCCALLQALQFSNYVNLDGLTEINQSMHVRESIERRNSWLAECLELTHESLRVRRLMRQRLD